jgi:pyridoxal phosphate enzyme (YggS family)
MAATDAAAAIVSRNLATVRAGIADACRRAGRSPTEVTLVGVTKYVSAELAGLLVAAGCVDLGESRPQSLWEKGATLAAAGHRPRWHLIGHLQRNKIRRTLPWLPLVHSLDSLRLLASLEAEAAAAGLTCAAVVEVNLSGDPGRTGASEEEAAAIVAAAAEAPHVQIRGLMGMAAAPSGGDGPRREFARLREFRDALVARLAAADGLRVPAADGLRVPAAGGLRELSMGMSGDFAEAILEGATIVRVGSALWEGVPAG